MLLRSMVFMAILGLFVGVGDRAQAELPRNFIQQGERFLAMGKYPAAMARYSKVIECCPGTFEASEAHNDIGVIHARQGNMDLAVKEYQAALQPPSYPLAHFNLGKALADKYKENPDEETREKAVFHLAEFRSYLSTAENLPPVITSQRNEIEAFLASTIQTLSENR
jgi:tetratricopeptide (TPR) repeat protein